MNLHIQFFETETRGDSFEPVSLMAIEEHTWDEIIGLIFDHLPLASTACRSIVLTLWNRAGGADPYERHLEMPLHDDESVWLAFLESEITLGALDQAEADLLAPLPSIISDGLRRRQELAQPHLN